MSTDLEHLKKEHVIVIYEGESEKAINEILYNNNKLIYKPVSKSERLIRKFTGTRNAKKFANENLNKDYEDTPVNIVRILDSEKENFKLGKVYKERLADGEIKIYDIYTKPEIEILLIHSENDYEKFKKSKKKPSVFCKDEYVKKFARSYKSKNIKSYKFAKEYFEDPDKLIDAIVKYNSCDKKKDKRYSLYDILDI